MYHLMISSNSLACPLALTSSTAYSACRRSLVWGFSTEHSSPDLFVNGRGRQLSCRWQSCWIQKMWVLVCEGETRNHNADIVKDTWTLFMTKCLVTYVINLKKLIIQKFQETNSFSLRQKFCKHALTTNMLMCYMNVAARMNGSNIFHPQLFFVPRHHGT
jgi:hypothetical protein